MNRTTVKVNLRIDPEDDMKISKISKEQNIKKADVFRNLIRLGLETSNHEKMTGKFEGMQESMETFLEKTGEDYEELKFEIGELYKRIEATNMNVLRMNFFLDEFSKVMMNDLSKYVEMRKTIKTKFLEFKNETRK